MCISRYSQNTDEPTVTSLSCTLPTPKSRRQHVALGRILPARGRLDVADAGKIALELRHQFCISPALKCFGEKRSARLQNVGGEGRRRFDQANHAQLVRLA